MEVILEFVRALWANSFAQYIVYTIVAGLVLGVLAAIKDGTFSFVLLGDWMRDKVMFLLLPYLVIVILAEGIDGPFVAIAPLAAATVELSLLGSIYNSLRTLGLGKWLPELSVTREFIESEIPF